MSYSTMSKPTAPSPVHECVRALTLNANHQNLHRQAEGHPTLKHSGLRSCGSYAAGNPAPTMDSFIIISPRGALKEVGRDILHGLGVRTYLRAIGFDPYSF